MTSYVRREEGMLLVARSRFADQAKSTITMLLILDMFRRLPTCAGL